MLKRMLIERGAMGQKKEVKLEDIAERKDRSLPSSMEPRKRR